jgi:acylphosphatase
MADSRAHAYISGRVQGVSFRYYTYHEALKRGLRGWIRNLQDGRVEAVFEGEKGAVQKVLEWSEIGPPGAHVDGVEVEWQEPSDSLTGFNVRATASAGDEA